jgi:hypothetical protein
MSKAKAKKQHFKNWGNRLTTIVALLGVAIYLFLRLYGLAIVALK